MKIVVNRASSGFYLSYQGMTRYAELAGLTLWPEGLDDCFDKTKYWIQPPNQRTPEPSHDEYMSWPISKRQEYNDNYRKSYLHDEYFERTDKFLIQTVEELGINASGDFTVLQVVEIPDDVDWEIESRENGERIVEKHRVW